MIKILNRKDFLTTHKCYMYFFIPYIKKTYRQYKSYSTLSKEHMYVSTYNDLKTNNNELLNSLIYDNGLVNMKYIYFRTMENNYYFIDFLEFYKSKGRYLRMRILCYFRREVEGINNSTINRIINLTDYIENIIKSKNRLIELYKHMINYNKTKLHLENNKNKFIETHLNICKNIRFLEEVV